MECLNAEPKCIVHDYDCVVVGSGAAGFNAANRIALDGRRSVALVSENINWGTSRNTGSDKQTYYKLAVSGDEPDSVGIMTSDLFEAGSVDGDNALAEAALSTKCFMNLVELGVQFPKNKYGEYVGYITDHDTHGRASSVGPYTSKFMTEALQRQAEKLDIDIHDHMYAVEVLTSDDSSLPEKQRSAQSHKDDVIGLLCFDTDANEFVVFKCPNVILATGGPAAVYANSVYPASQWGSSALALRAGASLQNMCEWQYGLASVKPRWNVSGSYMQVLPRFVAVDADGNEHEFLFDFFGDAYTAMSNVFLKGYQWPFDSNKVLHGSSVIDLLVYEQTVLKGRQVYLDFTKNAFGLDSIDFGALSSESAQYLQDAGVVQDTPYKRLLHLNKPAADFYAEHGANLESEYLQVDVCSQHNNGGIAVDEWWQTSVPGLFAVGECAGTHGITRPGGSALNAGQVGSLRAAEYVCEQCFDEVDDEDFEAVAYDSVELNRSFVRELGATSAHAASAAHAASTISARDGYKNLQKIMSACAGAIRDINQIHEQLPAFKEQLGNFTDIYCLDDCKSPVEAYKFRNSLITAIAVMETILQFESEFGYTRGSALVVNERGQLREGLNDLFRFIPDKKTSTSKILEVKADGHEFYCQSRDVRPIPKRDNVFENVWSGYRHNRNVY